MANIFENFLSLSNTKKVIYMVVLAAAIGAAVTLFNWASQPEYQLLFSNLSQEDASLIVEKLKEKRIPYKISGAGSVLVPQEKVHETRLELAGAGIPKGGGVGLEIFDKTGFGMTEFTQKVNYIRAIQGELARTIGWLSEVDTARVHIVIPERRLFSQEGEKARASVIVKLRSGAKLDYAQVQGIVHLVASSVAGLSPQNVTVVDTSGQMLTKSAEGDTQSLLTSSQLEYQRTVEKDMEKGIQTIIEPAVGKDKVIAKVSLDIDFTRMEKTEERFDPDSVVVRSEQKSKEKSTGESVGGVPGVASNIPGSQLNQQSSSSIPSRAERANEVINYEINKVVSRTIVPTGMVKRISASILVDGSYENKKGADGKEERKYIPRTQEELKKFESLVKAAVGFAQERGDKIEVVNIPFDTKTSVDIEDIVKQSPIKEYLPSIIRYGTILILSMLLFLFVLRPLITGILKERELPKAGMEALSSGAVHALGHGAVPHVITEQPKDVKQRVLELAKENPQQAAQIIKTWVKSP